MRIPNTSKNLIKIFNQINLTLLNYFDTNHERHQKMYTQKLFKKYGK